MSKSLVDDPCRCGERRRGGEGRLVGGHDLVAQGLEELDIRLIGVHSRWKNRGGRSDHPSSQTSST